MESGNATSHPQMTFINPEFSSNCLDIYKAYPTLECDKFSLACRDMQEIYKGFLTQLYFQCHCQDKEILPSFKRAVETFEAKCTEDSNYEIDVVEQQNRIKDTAFGRFYKYSNPTYFSALKGEIVFIEKLNNHNDQFKSE